MSIRALMVCDTRLYREGLELALRGSARITLVGAVAGCDHALEIAVREKPDVVLMDVAMPTVSTCVQRLRALMPGIKLVGLAVGESDRAILECARSGLSGFTHKNASIDEVIKSVEDAARGELDCPPRVAGLLIEMMSQAGNDVQVNGSLESLSGRERDVLERIERGCSNKEIARALEIEVATVKNHVHSLLHKLGVRRRGEAAALLRRTQSASSSC